MSKKKYGNKELLGDSACPQCVSQGRDQTGNHLQHWRNIENEEEFTYCNRCGYYEKITDANRSTLEGSRKVKEELEPAELAVVLGEVLELPFKALTSRGIRLDVAERFGVRVGLSYTDGSTPVSHFYPKKKDGTLVSFKVRNLDPKYFYAIGNGSGCDFFGMDQAQLGDIWTGRLHIFEDELSCMSAYQALTENSSSRIKPATIALPDGAGSIATVLSRLRSFVESFEEVVLCMDNDEAGEEAVNVARKIYPNIKIARIPKGLKKDGSPIKDANDLLMEGRSTELNNLLRFKAAKESPAGSVSIADCIEEALKKPEWGIPFPWDGLTQMTFGLRLGEIVAIGAGVSLGKTLLAHEMASWLTIEHKFKVGVFLLEEQVGDSVKNIAGKSANTPFHRPDLEFDPNVLREEAMRYDGQLFLYNNFGQNEWADIKQCMRFWVVEHGVKWIFLDNITTLVAHLTPAEANTEISKIASELAGMCAELDFTCFIFSHLNAPQSGAPHEEGGPVKEVQFTGSRSLMRWCQLIIGFERNKQAEGEAKNYSMIRLLKDRKFGRSGVVHTKYIVETGRLLQREEHEINPADPFKLNDSDAPSTSGNGETPY
ncbi:MAG: DnaB-like helicase C-terminal domain-containing protein [Bacteroidales bacterium]